MERTDPLISPKRELLASFNANVETPPTANGNQWAKGLIKDCILKWLIKDCNLKWLIYQTKVILCCICTTKSYITVFCLSSVI